MIKKIISLILSTALFLSFAPASFAENEQTTAEIVFGRTIQSNGIASITSNEIKTYSGIEAMTVDPMKSQLEFNLDVTSALANISDGSSLNLNITYYDKGTGKAALFYDGINGKTEHSERLILTDTGSWKTKTFFLQDPVFNDRVDGADISFRLSGEHMGTSTSELAVSKVELVKTGTKSVYKTTITTNRIADAYFSDGEVKFDLKVAAEKGMKAESKNCDITCEIIGENDKVVWQKTTEQAEIPYTESVTAENVSFGVLTLRVTAENKELGCKTIKEKEISYIKDAPMDKDYGLGTHYGGSWADWGMENATYLMSRSGAGFIRDGMTWDQYETSVGNYAVPPIKKRMMDLLKKYGMEQLAVDSYGNRAYQPGIPAITYMPETEETIEAFSNYAGEMARLGMKYHEIWNEPNTGFNSGNTGWDVYTEIVKKCYEKVKAADPTAHISAGSIVSIPDVPYNVLTEIFDAGGGDYMDSICIHPYIWDASPSQTNFHGKLEKLRKWLDDRGYPNIDVWVTEMGWGAGPAQAFTYEQQAAYLAQSYIIFKAVNPTGKFVWYDAIQDGLSETDREHNFGIITSWGAGEKALHPRKAYVALANMSDMMVGSDFVDYENVDNKGYSYHFKNRDGADMYAVFSSEKSYSMGFKTDSKSVKAIDLYGNESEIYAVDGVINVNAGEEVVYLIGSNLKSCTPTVYPEATEIKMVYGEESDINVIAPENAVVTYSTVADGLTVECENKSAKVSMNEPKKDKDSILFTASIDDKTVLTGKIMIDYIDAVEVSILNVPYSVENYNRWVGTLVIKNNSNLNPISGKMVFDEPDLFSQKLHPIEIPKVNPQETKQIKFHLPEILKKEVYNLSARVILDNGYVKSFADRIDFAVARYAENIKIDGVMEDDEWTMGTALTFDDPTKYFTYSGYSFNGPEDLSGKAVVAYDEENIYLGVKVTDDVFYCKQTTNGIWMDDSIQCAMAYAKLNGDPDSTARTEFGMALTPEGEKVFTYSVEDISINLGEIKVKEVGGDIAIKREGNVTTYELKMPITQLFQRNAKIGPGYRVAFSLLINDNDGNGRKGGAEIASGIIGQKYIELFTYLQFMEK